MGSSEPPGAQPPRWTGPPDDVLPAVVPLEQLVYHASGVMVALHSAEVYMDGCVLHVKVTARRADETEPQWNDLKWELSHERLAQFGRFSVEYSDGTVASSDEEPPLAPVLKGVGSKWESRGSDWLRAHRQLWLWPLPPRETFQFVVHEPVSGVSAARVSVDGVAISRASEHAVAL